MATLSGTYLDLITDGVPAPVNRDKIVMAVRRVMLSAHRNSIGYDKIHGLLTDDDRVLATQIATASGLPESVVAALANLGATAPFQDQWAAVRGDP